MINNQFIPISTLEKIDNVRNLYEIDNVLQKKNNTIEESQTSVGFGEVLKNQLDKVNNYQVANEQNVEKYLNGEDIDMYEVMVSAKEASMTLQMAVEIRNKLVDAYSEINRMQI